MSQLSSCWLCLLGLTLLKLLLLRLLLELLELLLRLLLELLKLLLRLLLELLLLGLLLELLELLLGLLELLLGLELLGLGLSPAGVKVVWAPGLKLRSRLLGLLELLLLLDIVEPVSCLLAPGPFLQPPPLLLQLKLSPGLLLSLSLLLLPPPLCLCSLLCLPLPLQLPADHIGQGLYVQIEEHLECMLHSLIRKAGKLILGKLLNSSRKSKILLIEYLLLLSGESLPGSRVLEGLKSQLLVFQLQRNGKPLTGCQHQLVCIPQVNLSQVGNEGLPFLA